MSSSSGDVSSIKWRSLDAGVGANDFGVFVSDKMLSMWLFADIITRSLRYVNCIPRYECVLPVEYFMV